MRDLAQAHTHGFRDDNLSLGELRSKLRRGERIVASCGTVASLGKAELKKAGIPARLVGSVTRQAFDDENDGHVMLEARPNEREGWRVYDLDMNIQPLTREGKPMNIQQFTRQGYSGHYRTLARDPTYDFSGERPDDAARWIQQMESNTFYGRVLGTPTVFHKGRIVYRDASDSRLPGMGYERVSRGEWRS